MDDVLTMRVPGPHFLRCGRKALIMLAAPMKFTCQAQCAHPILEYTDQAGEGHRESTTAGQNLHIGWTVKSLLTSIILRMSPIGILNNRTEQVKASSATPHQLKALTHGHTDSPVDEAGGQDA